MVNPNYNDKFSHLVNAATSKTTSQRPPSKIDKRNAINAIMSQHEEFERLSKKKRLTNQGSSTNLSKPNQKSPKQIKLDPDRKLTPEELKAKKKRNKRQRKFVEPRLNVITRQEMNKNIHLPNTNVIMKRSSGILKMNLFVYFHQL